MSKTTPTTTEIVAEVKKAYHDMDSLKNLPFTVTTSEEWPLYAVYQDTYGYIIHFPTEQAYEDWVITQVNIGTTFIDYLSNDASVAYLVRAHGLPKKIVSELTQEFDDFSYSYSRCEYLEIWIKLLDTLLASGPMDLVNPLCDALDRGESTLPIIELLGTMREWKGKERHKKGPAVLGPALKEEYDLIVKKRKERDEQLEKSNKRKRIDEV